MATNVSEKDKTLNEIIDMCVEKRVHYRQFLNDFMLTHSEDWHDSEADVTYGERIMFLRGKIQAFDECAACCESMLGRTAPPTNAEIEMPKSKQWRNGSAGTAANGMASIATRRKTRMTHGIMPVRFPASMRNISDRPRNYSHWHGGR